MRRQRDPPAGDVPDVQVMHAAHARQARRGVPDLLQADRGRHAFHQDVQRLAQQMQVEPRMSSAITSDRIGSIGRPAGEVDHRPRHHRDDRAEHIRDHVQQRRTRVQVALAAADDEGHRQVQQQADEGHHQHPQACDGRGCEQAPDRLDRDQHHDQQHAQPVDESGDHLRPRQTEAVTQAGGALAEPGGEPRQAERNGVREHVPRVADQRERPEPQAAHQFHAGISQGEQQRHPQGAAAGHAPRECRRLGVVMLVMVMMVMQRHRPSQVRGSGEQAREVVARRPPGGVARQLRQPPRRPSAAQRVHARSPSCRRLPSAGPPATRRRHRADCRRAPDRSPLPAPRARARRCRPRRWRPPC